MNAPAAPLLAINWERVTVKSGRRTAAAGDAPWQWHFWRATINRMTFQVGRIPASIMDMSPAHRSQDPGSAIDAAWQLWAEFDHRDGPEFMSSLFVSTEQEALQFAEQRIDQYWEEQARLMAKELESIRTRYDRGQLRLAI